MKKSERLAASSDFHRVYQNGSSVASKHLVLYYLPSGDGTRIGFSVGKKLGSAVARNRVKRRLRAASSPVIPLLVAGHDLIIIARKPLLELDYDGIERVVKEIVGRAALLRN